MTKKKKAKPNERKKEVKTEDMAYLDLAGEINSQMVYLLEMAGLLRHLFGGKTTAIIPLSSVLNDLCDRLEWLKETIEELKGFCK